jgi:hypothetical protein
MEETSKKIRIATNDRSKDDYSRGRVNSFRKAHNTSTTNSNLPNDKTINDISWLMSRVGTIQIVEQVVEESKKNEEDNRKKHEVIRPTKIKLELITKIKGDQGVVDEETSSNNLLDIKSIEEEKGSIYKETQLLQSIQDKIKNKEEIQSNLEEDMNGITNQSEDIQFSQDLSSIHL